MKRRGDPTGRATLDHHLGRTAYTLSPWKKENVLEKWRSGEQDVHPGRSTQGPHHFTQGSGTTHVELENSQG